MRTRRSDESPPALSTYYSNPMNLSAAPRDRPYDTIVRISERQA